MADCSTNLEILAQDSRRIGAAPVTGAKTMTTSAAEIYAGGSNRVSGRFAMVIYNEGSVPLYVGPSGITTATGGYINPGDYRVFYFKADVVTAIYGISSIASHAIRVEEYS